MSVLLSSLAMMDSKRRLNLAGTHRQRGRGEGRGEGERGGGGGGRGAPWIDRNSLNTLGYRHTAGSYKFLQFHFLPERTK